MSYEVEPEPGEKFALIGDAEIVIKGFGHQMRKGNLVVTDRRIAFKGRFAITSVIHLVAHAAGSGRVDMSIPYEHIRNVDKPSIMSGFHIDINYLDSESGKEEKLRVKLNRWGHAVATAHAVDAGIQAIREINFIPIVGDFISIGANIAHWKAGRDAADTWIQTINTTKMEKQSQ
ncbi:MAG: hypothetical protein R6W91_00995 [Thermoplasmata archaeon]